MCLVVRVACECNLRVSYKSLVATCGAASKRGGVGFSNIWSASFLELFRKIKVVQMLAIFNFDFFMKVIEREEKRWKASIMQNSHVPNNFYLTSSYFRFPAQSGKNWYSPGPWADLDKVLSCRVFMSLWVLMFVSAFFWQNLINIKHQHNELSINTSRGTKLNYMQICNWFSYSKQWGACELKIVTNLLCHAVQGVPEKTLFCLQRPVTQIWKQLLGQVGEVFKS